MKYLSILTAFFAIMGLIGCHPHITVENDSHPPRHKTVVIESSHTHHDDCGHVWDGGVWIDVHNHRHGPGCGHVHSGGRWSIDIKKGPGHHNTKVEVHTPKVDVKVKKHH